MWITFATGDTPVSNGVLGTLDTTLMQNGLYDIRLTAEDASGNLETVETIYQIDGNMKIGIFTLTFTNLTIPGEYGISYHLNAMEICFREITSFAGQHAPGVFCSSWGGFLAR